MLSLRKSPRKVESYSIIFSSRPLLQLRKSVRTPEFPPKRLRNTSHKLLEERRAGLELYLQRLVRLNPVPGALLEFLGLSGGGEALHEAEVGRLAAVCPDRPTHQVRKSTDCTLVHNVL